MPRSDYIYISFLGELPLSAFTVKYELYDWLKAQPEGLRAGVTLVRLKDGGGADAVFITAEQLFSSYEKKAGGKK